MLYAVAGVTGNTGKVVADALLGAGAQVRVIVRDAAKGADWAARGAEVAVADLGDAGALADALRGADGAYLLVPPNMTTGDFRAYQARTGAALVEAVRQSGVGHVVLLSSVGAQHPDGTGPIKGLYPVEQGLRAHGVPATFLRAGYFMENLLGSFSMLDQGLLPSFTPAAQPYRMVATRDIGETAAALLLEGPPPAGTVRIVELGTTGDSMADVAAALSALLGRPIAVAEAPVEAMAPTLQGFGVPADIAELYAAMTRGVLAGLVDFEGEHRRVVGPTTLQRFLGGVVGASA